MRRALRRTRLATVLTLPLALSLASCEAVEREAQEAAQSIADLTVSQIGALASRILENPESAQEILESSGITVERLDEMVYEIASDAEKTAEYLQAVGEGGA